MTRGVKTGQTGGWNTGMNGVVTFLDFASFHMLDASYSGIAAVEEASDVV